MFLMIHGLWTVFSHVCSLVFRIPHGRFCADLIVAYVNSQGMRQPDKVYLAIMTFQTFVPSNPISCLFMTCLWLTFLIQKYLELSVSTWICVEREVEVEQKEKRTILWVSECVDVCVCVCVWCAGSLSDSHEMPRESNYCRHVYNPTC